MQIAFAYEAERLRTGDESAGGPSATADPISSDNSAGTTVGAVERLLPRKYMNDALYVTPVWVGMTELLALVAGLLCVVGWGGFELYRFVTTW